jgi:hypothetical protein
MHVSCQVGKLLRNLHGFGRLLDLAPVVKRHYQIVSYYGVCHLARLAGQCQAITYSPVSAQYAPILLRSNVYMAATASLVESTRRLNR